MSCSTVIASSTRQTLKAARHSRNATVPAFVIAKLQSVPVSQSLQRPFAKGTPRASFANLCDRSLRRSRVKRCSKDAQAMPGRFMCPVNAGRFVNRGFLWKRAFAKPCSPKRGIFRFLLCEKPSAVTKTKQRLPSAIEFNGSNLIGNL